MTSSKSASILRLNLGCGANLLDGYINVDVYGDADVIWNLEETPWPWKSSSASEVILNHVLEHLGQQSATFIDIIKELYRVCQHSAMVQINVPHPRHDFFIMDPTHCRVITPNTMSMFSKKLNLIWQENHAANTPLALIHDVDFDIERTEEVLDPFWQEKVDRGFVMNEHINELARNYNNVIMEYKITLKVIKET